MSTTPHPSGPRTEPMPQAADADPADLAAILAEPDEEPPHAAPVPARLVRGAGQDRAGVVLTAEQEAVAGLGEGHGAHLVLGAPGTGRSTVAVEYAARRLEAGLDPESLLVLAPSREAAARLRDALTERLAAAGHGTRAVTPVRTWASYAFDLIRRARVTGPLRGLSRPPRLLSGAEQDTVIAELLDTYAAGLAPAPEWPRDVAQAVDTRGFRREVRELVDRMSEFGVEPGVLQELGRRHGRPVWEAAAELVQDYRDRLDLGMAEAFDAAGLISTAVRLLTERFPDDPERDAAALAFAEAEQARLRAIVVDDLQEAGPAVHDLLVHLGRGRDVLLTASPDTAVQGFRGARPDLVSRYPAALDPDAVPGASSPDPDARTHVLTAGHRMSAGVQEGWLRAARRIRQRTVGVELTRTRTVPAGEGGAVEGHAVPSRAHEDQLVLERVLRIHHEDGVPLDGLAVIARSGARAAALGRHLEAAGVPVRREAAGEVLKDEPAVAPLLTLLRAVSDQAEDPEAGVALEADEAVALLRGPYGRATALNIRRLRQDLLAAERARGGRRTSDELLVAAFGDPALAGEETDRHRALRRLAWMHRDGLAAAREPGATAETVLWAVWAASGRADRWRAAALGRAEGAEGRREARRADADLDAVVALFRIAERFVDQFPGAAPADFSRYMESQDLPMDTLARRAETGDAVHVLTPAGAAGREWDTVIVVGLQEGAWPNTALRGQLLGATDLTDLLTAAAVDGAWPTDHRTRLAEVRQDELRMLAAAVSRARRRVVATAVRNEDETPSDFLDLLDPVADVAAGRPLTEVPLPLTAAALVAAARRRLEAPDLPEALVGLKDPAAAAVLAALAEDGVAAAALDRWWGLAPLSTDAPLTDIAAEPVRLSPSRAQTALENPLNWLLYHVGAQAGGTLAQSIGVLVHSVAEHHPDGEPGAVRAELERRLPELGLPEGWTTDLQHARARRLVEAYIRYWSQMRAEGRRPVAQEVALHVPLAWGEERVEISGVIDRLEVDAAGRPYVVDLKTGSSKPDTAELERLPQLAAYQVALRARGLELLAEDPATDPALRRALSAIEAPAEPGGAALVQLGAATKTKTTVQPQPAVTAVDDWARDQVFTAARRTVGPRFLAVHRPGVRCALPSVCPLCTEGRQATEWHR
ncbi:ATP-dependent helicase [Micrococcus porci]|uniref:ATP-dependent helicase n=1 Tax=Micrococcus porci TaxID=2856555 RepID=UPI003CF9B863